ncbi:MAG: ATP-binding protein [bacterium]
MARFKEIYVRLLDEMKIKTHRYLYSKLLPDERIVGIAGQRGVGKTTMMLQYLLENGYNTQNSLYFSADHIYFSEYRLYDYIEKKFLEEGIEFFFIDEIHRYAGWSQELKNIYDSFPKIRIVFSGSSMLDLVKGEYDMSRRALLMRLEGVSFREYLSMKNIFKTDPFTMEELIRESVGISEKLSTVPMLSGHFKDYLKYGYYPFSIDNTMSFFAKLLSIIDKTIQIDIAGFYNLRTQNLSLFKQILVFLATNPPGEFNVHNLAQSLKVDDKTVANYLEILMETGFVTPLFYKSGGHRMLRKPLKYYLNNSSLYFTLATESGHAVETGTLRESFFLSMMKNGGLTPHYSAHGDFEVKGFTFEVGGKNKTRKQMKNVEKSFVVKDDLLIAQKGEIPLYLFGFLY